MNYDVYFAGVGGQGILTIGKLLADLALQYNMASSFYPSKGIAQRGGFVKAQLRIGREDCGPNIPERGADLIVAMERSEALKVIHFVKKQGEFLLFSELWAPTAVALGKAPYPSLEDICQQIEDSGAQPYCVSPESIPTYQGEKAPANLYVLGSLFHYTKLNHVFRVEDVRNTIQKKWKQNADANLIAFDAGFAAEAMA